MRTLPVLLALVLLLAAPAAAKGPVDLRLCGEAGCTQVFRDQPVHVVLSAVARAGQPPPAVPRYRLEVTFPGPEGRELGPPMDRLYAPGPGVVQQDDGRWYRLSAEGSTLLRKLAADLRPFGAAAPRGDGTGGEGTAAGGAPGAGAPAGSGTVLVAGSGVLLLGLLAVVPWRRRRAQARASIAAGSSSARSTTASASRSAAAS